MTFGINFVVSTLDERLSSAIKLKNIILILILVTLFKGNNFDELFDLFDMLKETKIMIEIKFDTQFRRFDMGHFKIL